jgi:Zn-dependent M28 family amino/carboxypeptidase
MFKWIAALSVALFFIVSLAIAITTQPWVAAIQSSPPSIDSERLRRHVEKLSIDFYPRSFEQTANTQKTIEYIFSEFRKAGATVSYQEFLIQNAVHKNVIAKFGPSDTNEAVIVLGAHYDSHGDAQSGARSRTGYTKDSHTPGADDNASGVAGLIELAYALGKQTQARPIELVAYASEEPPHFRTEFMGSAFHANEMKTNGRKLKLMISVEMIGYFSDEAKSQNFPFPGMSALYSDKGDFAAIVGNLKTFSETRRAKAIMRGATDLPIYSINASPIVPGIDFSDHLNYWHLQLPALMVTDTSFMRNGNYHRSTDTANTLDYVRMAKVVQGLYAICQQF